MPRWIVFDQGTFAKLRRQFPREHVFEHGARNAVAYALDRPETTVAVLAPGPDEKAGVAVFRRGMARKITPQQKLVTATPKPKPAAEKAPVKERADNLPRSTPHSQVRAGGLLGLRDETVFEDEPKPQRGKKWWRRFWPEDED